MINNLAADSAGEQVIRNSLEDFLVAVLVKAVKNIFMSLPGLTMRKIMIVDAGGQDGNQTRSMATEGRGPARVTFPTAQFDWSLEGGM
jgi:hypothetical protein